jgi:hypothetical protein
MTLGEIQALLEDMIRSGVDAASLSVELSEEDLKKLEAEVMDAIPVVAEGEPGTYPLDVPHRMALALVAIAMGATLEYNLETGDITGPDTGR